MSDIVDIIEVPSAQHRVDSRNQCRQYVTQLPPLSVAFRPAWPSDSVAWLSLVINCLGLSPSPLVLR